MRCVTCTLIAIAATLAPILSDAQRRSTPDRTELAVVQLDVGAGTACALLHNDTIWCFGSNAFGSRGWRADELSAREEVPLRGVSRATQLTVGSHHACAVYGQGEAACWGENLHGQLGNGTLQSCTIPRFISVGDRSSIVEMAAGED